MARTMLWAQELELDGDDVKEKEKNVNGAPGEHEQLKTLTSPAEKREAFGNRLVSVLALVVESPAVRAASQVLLSDEKFTDIVFERRYAAYKVEHADEVAKELSLSSRVGLGNLKEGVSEAQVGA